METGAVCIHSNSCVYTAGTGRDLHPLAPSGVVCASAEVCHIWFTGRHLYVASGFTLCITDGTCTITTRPTAPHTQYTLPSPHTQCTLPSPHTQCTSVNTTDTPCRHGSAFT